MGRLRQLFPSNYNSSGNVSTEFESLFRYVNAAEMGNLTLGELLAKLFDDNGDPDLPVELRKNTDGDIEYRVGEYTSDADGWTSLVNVADLRGETGSDVGTVGEPVMASRQDTQPTNGSTVVSYTHDSTEDLVVFVDGVLKREGLSYDYTSDATTNTVTFTSTFAGTETVTIYKLRTASLPGYNRYDVVTTGSQTVFPFTHGDDAQMLVYLNGILQRYGGSYDYINDPDSDTVTFTSPITAGNLVTIITLDDGVLRRVAGLMLEADYVDTTTGLINYSALGIADGDITMAKISGLTAAVAAHATITVSATSPVSPSSGDLWLDTAASPNELKFWDSTQWLRTNPDADLPAYTTSDAGKVLHINGTGTGLEFADTDLSDRIPTSEKGIANGVATLDSSGRLPTAQLPEVLSSDTVYMTEATPSATTYTLKRVFKQSVQLTGIAVRSSAGTANVQLALNGVGVGSTYAVSTTPNEVTLGSPVDITATSASVTIDVIVSSPASLADLDVAVSLNVVSS